MTLQHLALRLDLEVFKVCTQDRVQQRLPSRTLTFQFPVVVVKVFIQIRVPQPILNKASEQEIIEHELTHLSFRSWCRHCINGRERRTVARQLKRRRIPAIHVFCGQRKSDESCAQHRGSEDVDGRMDMSRADGMAS